MHPVRGMCHALRFVECVMCRDLWNVLCTRSRSTNVFYNGINGYKLVNAHNFFIQIVLVIKWFSSLSLWCKDSIP